MSKINIYSFDSQDQANIDKFLRKFEGQYAFRVITEAVQARNLTDALEAVNGIQVGSTDDVQNKEKLAKVIQKIIDRRLTTASENNSPFKPIKVEFESPEVVEEFKKATSENPVISRNAVKFEDLKDQVTYMGTLEGVEYYGTPIPPDGRINLFARENTPDGDLLIQVPVFDVNNILIKIESAKGIKNYFRDDSEINDVAVESDTNNDEDKPTFSKKNYEIDLKETASSTEKIVTEGVGNANPEDVVIDGRKHFEHVVTAEDIENNPDGELVEGETILIPTENTPEEEDEISEYLNSLESNRNEIDEQGKSMKQVLNQSEELEETDEVGDIEDAVKEEKPAPKKRASRRKAEPKNEAPETDLDAIKKASKDA